VSEPVLEKEEKGGTWWARDPDVPGAYGTGPTREAALADLAEAKALLAEYDAGRLDDSAEDAEDVRLADEAMDEIHAGGRVYTHEEVVKALGLAPAKDSEDAEDIRLADESRAKIRAGGATIPLEDVLKRYGLAPVKVGVVSDIHGDVFSLDAALGHLRRMGCDPILCPGDLLDVEPFGEEVVQRCRAEKLICIRGNHERWAIERRRRRPDPRKSAPSIVEPADLFSGGAVLSREALVWLAALPSHWSAELAGVRVSMWHARPGSDMEGIEAEKTGPALQRRLLDQAAADVLVVGHTHEAFSLFAGAGRIVNPGACCSKTLAFKQSGSLAVPDGYRPATFGVLELPSKRFRVFQAADGRELKASEDLRIVESRLADLDAGRTRALSLEEAKRKLGMKSPPAAGRGRKRR
jgi:predicted phosphodiesterase/predicted RNase H-like HicB family nuclease